MVVLGPGVRSGYPPETAEAFVLALGGRLEIERTAVEPYAVHAAEAVQPS